MRRKMDIVMKSIKTKVFSVLFWRCPDDGDPTMEFFWNGRYFLLWLDWSLSGWLYRGKASNAKSYYFLPSFIRRAER